MNRKTQTASRANWLIPAGLPALAFIPIVAGAFRLTMLAGGVKSRQTTCVSSPLRSRSSCTCQRDPLRYPRAPVLHYDGPVIIEHEDRDFEGTDDTQAKLLWPGDVLNP